MVDTPQDLSSLVESINALAKAYNCKPDGYFSINTLAVSIISFVIQNELEDTFHAFVASEKDKLERYKQEVLSEASRQGHPV
jgi:hypothetical protein